MVRVFESEDKPGCTSSCLSKGRRRRKRAKHNLELDYEVPKYQTKFMCQQPKPKNGNQEIYFRFLQNAQFSIILATGPAGTGKTLLATSKAIDDFYNNRVSKVILTRPTCVEESDLGFLPGTLEQKMEPWLRPIYDILYKYFSPEEIENFIKRQEIEIVPLPYMRGRTFENAWIICDEMQNSSPEQMKMVLTRIGKNSRMVMTGDLKQHDKKDNSGLKHFIDKLPEPSDSPIYKHLRHIEFMKKDIERHEVIAHILDLLE